MYFAPKDIAENVLANPHLSSYLTVPSILPFRFNDEEIKSINNSKAYQQHSWTTIHLHHVLYEKNGTLSIL